MASSDTDELKICPKHPDEKLKYYCCTHETIGCLVCMTMIHKFCEFDEIEKMSDKFTQYEEYTNFENCMKYISKACGENASKMEEEIKTVETSYELAISAIERRRRYLNDILDGMQSELMDQAKKFKEQNQKPKEAMKVQYESIGKKVDETISVTSLLKKDKKYTLLFCVMKNERRALSIYQSELYGLASDYHKQECKFVESTHLESHFESTFTVDNLFGKLNIDDCKLGACNTPEKLDRQYVYYINIKHGSDNKTCNATGLAFLSCDQIAVADNANKSVKIIDVSHDKILSRITLSSSPCDVAVIPPHQLAVSLNDEKVIQLLSFEKGLTKEVQIKTQGCCSGLRHKDGNLIVTYTHFNTQIIEALSPKGDILFAFKNKRGEFNISSEPSYIDLSPNAKRMYICDHKIVTINRISTESCEIMNEIRLKGAMGVAVTERGSVFVCSKTEDSVYLCDDDFTNGRIVLGRKNGIAGPMALAINHSKSQLFVSCGRGDPKVRDKLHVFKIIYGS